MRRIAQALFVWTTTIVAPALFAASAAAQHGGHGGDSAPPVERRYVEKLRIGGEGDITFRAPTQIGAFLFKPGRYRFELVVDGDAHFVVFTNLDLSTTERPAIGRVGCKVERMRKPAKNTEVHVIVQGQRSAVEQIQVQGEAVRYVFALPGWESGS